MPLIGSSVNLTEPKKKNQWNWRWINKNCINWNAKRKTELKKINNNNVREYPRAVGHIKQSNMCIIRITKGEDWERAEEIFEDQMAKNLPKLMTDTKLYIQESQRIPRRTNIKIKTKQNLMPTCFIFKLLKTKYKNTILKTAKGKKSHITYKDFLLEIIQPRKWQSDIFITEI